MNLRTLFSQLLHEEMKKNKDIFLVTGDLGYGILNNIRNSYPKRFINVGAAEQSMIGVGVGLALEGKIPFVYSITPFLLYRPFETIRNYLHHENIPVKLIGSGRNKDYIHDGFSHWCEEDKQVISTLENVIGYWPSSEKELRSQFKMMIKNSKPYYLNLCR